MPQPPQSSHIAQVLPQEQNDIPKSQSADYVGSQRGLAPCDDVQSQLRGYPARMEGFPAASHSFEILVPELLRDVTALCDAHYEEVMRLKIDDTTRENGISQNNSVGVASGRMASSPFFMELKQFLATHPSADFTSMQKDRADIALAQSFLRVPRRGPISSSADGPPICRPVSKQLLVDSHSSSMVQSKSTLDKGSTPSNGQSSAYGFGKDLSFADVSSMPTPTPRSSRGSRVSNITKSVYTTMQFLRDLKDQFTDVVRNAIFNHYTAVIKPSHTGVATKRIHETINRVGELALAKGWRKRTMEYKEKGNIFSSLILSHKFDVVCAIAIVLNAVILGIATDESARSDNPDELPSIYVVANYAFAVWFLLELLLRIYSVGICHWLFSTHWRWNVFDFMVVVADLFHIVIEAALQHTDATLQNITALRMLRVFRIARALRVVRLIRFFKDLRLMVISILKSGAFLIWCMAMLTIVIYLFSIYLMQSIGNLRDLQKHFGSLSDAFYTLYLSISGGINWRQVADPLFSAHWTNGMVFCFYIFVTLFAILNIITGVFVENAMSSAHRDYEEVITEQMHSETSTLQELKRLFWEVDTQHAGSITFDEFGLALQDSRIRAKLKFLGIDVNEAEGIFRLLDLNGNQQVSIEEFVYGCMQVKGGAKNLDIATLLYENKRMADRWTDFTDFIKTEFSRQQDFEKRLELLFARSAQS